MSFLSARPIASLSSGLLARKGQARPAMRSQGLITLAQAAASLEDLGWNDMGELGAESPEPAPAPEFVPADVEVASVVEAEVPPVLVTREALRQEIERPAPAPVTDEGTPAPRVRTSPRTSAGTVKARAAFTLRLDAERHLRLRLASATADRSAQQLLIGALDALLATMPEIEALAAQLPSTPG